MKEPNQEMMEVVIPSIRRTITIPAPKVNVREMVLVHNYRKKPRDGKPVFERGEVCGLKYEHTFGGKFEWKYEVVLARKSDVYTNIFGHELGGNTIRLYVSDEGIKKL